MGMKTVFENRDKVITAFRQYLENANLEDLQGRKVRYIWEEFYDDFDKDSCPAVVLQKGPFSNLKYEVDQFSVVYPVNFDLQLVVVDYSIESLDKADKLTEDLMIRCLDAIEEGIYQDTLTSSLLNRVEYQSIQYGPSETSANPYFSSMRTIIVCGLKNIS